MRTWLIGLSLIGSRVRDGDGPDGPPRGDPQDRLPIDLMPLRLFCHCEHPKSAWQSQCKTGGLLGFTRSDTSPLCF